MKNSPSVVFKSQFIPTEKDILSNPNRFGSYADKRAFYTSQNKGNDYVNYIDTGKPAVKFTDYLGYTENHEKSAGAFNSNGLLSRDEINTLKDQLKATESPIWNGIISFTTKFGNEFMQDTNKAIEILKRTLPIFLKNAEFNPDNIVWYAGLHENTENRHIHLSFFEKEKTRYRAKVKGLHFSNGMISKYAMDKFKLDIELKLLDMQTYIYRDNALSSFKTARQQNEYYLKNDLLQLAKVLPDGRTAYNSENMNMYRYKVDRIIRKIIKNSPECSLNMQKFENQVEAVNLEIEKICGRNKRRFERFKTDNKYLSSLWSKLGNEVIRNAKDMKNYQDKIDYCLGKSLKERRYKKQLRAKQFDSLLKFNMYCDKEAIRCFQEHFEQLEKYRRETMKELNDMDFEM